jgi:hypothetical protein
MIKTKQPQRGNDKCGAAIWGNGDGRGMVALMTTMVA